MPNSLIFYMFLYFSLDIVQKLSNLDITDNICLQKNERKIKHKIKLFLIFLVVATIMIFNKNRASCAEKKDLQLRFE